jgi:hypothetical protein
MILTQSMALDDLFACALASRQHIAWKNQDSRFHNFGYIK